MYINITEDIIYILSQFANYYIGLPIGGPVGFDPAAPHQGDKVNHYTLLFHCFKKTIYGST